MTDPKWLTMAADLTRALVPSTKPPANLGPILQEMRNRAEAALPQVSAATGLHADPVPVYIVDRHGITASCFGLLRLSMKAIGLDEEQDGPKAKTSAIVTAPLLAFMSCHALGVYDGYSSDKRLLLCAPNMLGMAGRIDDRRDLVTDLVCLHEQTHRLQDANAPWMSDYIFEQLKIRLHVGCDETDADLCKIGKRQASQRIDVAMSIVEGHAQMISEDLMRERYSDFEDARKRGIENTPAIQKWSSRAVAAIPPLRKKHAQYKKGEAFCRTILGNAGMDTLNRVWSSPEMLPTPQEFSTPQLWLDRIG